MTVDRGREHPDDPIEGFGRNQRVDGWIAIAGGSLVAVLQVGWGTPTAAGWALAGGLLLIGVLRIATAPAYVRGLRWVRRKGEERRARRG